MFSSWEQSNLAITSDLRRCQNLLNLFSNHLNGFLKLFFPKKTFLKCPFIILHIKILLQTNFYMVSKFAEHLQHFHNIDRLLKQIWPLRIFLICCFHIKNSRMYTIPCDLRQCQILLNNINIFGFFSSWTGNLTRMQISRNWFPLSLQVS